VKQFCTFLDNGISTVNTSTVDGIVQTHDETDDLRQVLYTLLSDLMAACTECKKLINM
jgi:hypothetical protein